MTTQDNAPPGYATALKVLALGRAAFFGSADRDLPIRHSEVLRQDDRTPSFGFIGPRYGERRVLFLGINPGNGPRNDRRIPEDERMMPHLRRFAEQPSVETFRKAGDAYRAAAVTWPVWKRHCAAVIGHGRLALDEIAYANALPWRTESKAAFEDDIAQKAAQYFAGPLIAELKPNVVVALGKRAHAILALAGRIDAPIVAWNRAQAATSAVLRDRELAAEKIWALCGN